MTGHRPLWSSSRYFFVGHNKSRHLPFPVPISCLSSPISCLCLLSPILLLASCFSPSLVYHLPAPVSSLFSRLPFLIYRLPSVISRLSSPVYHLSSPVSHLSSPVSSRILAPVKINSTVLSVR